MIVDQFRRAKVYILTKFPLFGRLLSEFDVEECTKVTRVRISPSGHVRINAEYAATLTQAQFNAVMLAMVYRLLFRYWWRVGYRDGALFARAQSHLIHMDIHDMSRQHGITLLAPTPDMSYDAKYKEWSSELIYDDLLKKRDAQPQVDGDSSGARAAKDNDFLDVDPADTLLADSSERMRQQSARWQTVVQQAAMMQAQLGRNTGQGTMPGNAQILLDQLANPRIPWPEKLAQLSGTIPGPVDYTYARPNRRQHLTEQRLVGAMRKNEPVLTILLDSSGSMLSLQKSVVSEIIGLIDTTQGVVRLIVIDADIQADVDLPEAEDVIKNLKGAGGSDFRPAFEMLEREGDTSTVFAFTDGFIAVPEEKPSTLREVVFIVFDETTNYQGYSPNEDRDVAPWGITIVVSADGTTK